MTFELPVPLAIVDGGRQIVVLGTDGRRTAQTAGGDLLWATWGRADTDDVHSWPAWSPDGTQLAAFRMARSGTSSRAWITDVTGVTGAEVASVGGRLPIYLQWSPDGSWVAVLSQDDRELVLQRAPTRGPQEGQDPAMEVLRGSPLFFSWLADNRLAAFVGEGTPATPAMALISPDGSRRDLPGAPGNFCAPIPLDGALAYVAHLDKRVAVVVSSLDGSLVRELCTVDGLVALLLSPDGKTLARAISPDGTGSPYHDLELLDVETAARTPVTDLPCIAFFWLPAGDGLIVAVQDPSHSAVTWHRIGLDGSEEILIELVPSRDLRVYLRFFEQYAPSHPIVDPTGSRLVLCGTLPDEPDAVPHAWLVPIDGGPPQDLGESLFATFAPLVLEP